jgi:hypothetical protein
MMLFTMGFWILTIPFYPRRCIVCGSTESVWKKDIFASKQSNRGKVYLGADAWDHLKGKDDDATKNCPYCAETIKQAAIVCRFCNRELTSEKS